MKLSIPKLSRKNWKAVISGLVLVCVLLIIFSGISSSRLQYFQAELENGNLIGSISANPFRALRAKSSVSGYLIFKNLLGQTPVDLRDLKTAYPDAVKYLAYHSGDAEALAGVARYYFLSGMNLPAETLALKAVEMDPFNRAVRQSACLSQAYSFTYRERTMAANLDLLNSERNFVKSLKDIPPSKRVYYKVYWFFWKRSQKQNYHFEPEDYSFDPDVNKARLKVLEDEEQKLIPQYAFSLFLTDPSRWAPDALDLIDGKALKNPNNQEYRFIVSEWMGDTSTASEAYQAFLQQCPQDLEAKKRMDGFKSVYNVSPNEDQKMAGLDFYLPKHPKDNQWMAKEQFANQQFQPGYTIFSPEPAGTGGNDLEALDKIVDGVNSTSPGESKQDYVYPQRAENKLAINDLFDQAKPLRSCPLVLPLADGEGHQTRLGAYLSNLSMIRASYLPDSILNLDNPLEDFEWWGGQDLVPGSNAEKGQSAKMGTSSRCVGSLVQKKKGYEVKVAFSGEFPDASFSKTFKKNQLHMVPNWIADRMHHWLGTNFNRIQKAELKKPIFSDDESLSRALYLENFQSWHTDETPPWEGVFKANPDSSLVATIYYENKKELLGISDPKPLEAFLEKHPHDDQVKMILAGFYNDKFMYGKAIKIYFDLLSRNPTNTRIYSSIKYSFARINDWPAIRRFYDLAARKFPKDGRVQLEVGNFFRQYAWTARGDGWGYEVTAWNYSLMQKRLEIAEKHYRNSESLNPYDTRAEAGILTVGMGTDRTPAEMDAVFNQAVSLNPDELEPFTNRMEALKKKWGGSDQQMMDFARKWEKIHPRLMLNAIAEKATEEPGYNSDDTKVYYRFMGLPKNWSDLNDAYHQMLTLYPENFEMWGEYSYASAMTDHVQDFLKFLREKAGADSAVQAFFPYEVINAHQYRAAAIDWAEAGQVYLNTQSVWNDYYDALESIMKQDPENYGFLNEQAQRCVGWNRNELARRIFTQIGDHWTPRIWAKEKFEKYKEVAFGKSSPTWHVCTKPVNAKNEHY